MARFDGSGWRLLFVAGVVALCAATAWAKTDAAQAPFATTDNGVVIGRREAGVDAYLGIPYGRDPSGAWRWQPARPTLAWQAPKVSTEFGRVCPQPTTPELKLDAMSENCLNLNVWTPEQPGVGRPVMVWVHGGGFRVGSGRIDGATFARQGAVVVSLNYRLGLLGFFAHDSVKTRAANFGLLDMAAALSWVNRNIAEFGGDPHNVTVFGVSAGGMSLSMMLTSPETKGLFHKAIVQSGYATWGLPRSRLARRTAPQGMDGRDAPSAERQARELIATVTDKRQSLRRLRKIPAVDLVRALPSFTLPIVDGDTLLAEPGVTFLRGKQHKVPILTGGTSFEGSVMPSSGIGLDTFRSWFGADIHKVQALYAQDYKRSADFGLTRAFGDARYLLGGRTLAAQSRRAKSWLYFVDYVPKAQAANWPGTPHGVDAYWLFNGQNEDDPITAALARRMQQYWLNFARRSDPNGPGLVAWPNYDPTSDQWLVLGATEEVRQGVLKNKLDWFEQRYQERVAGALDKSKRTN